MAKRTLKPSAEKAKYTRSAVTNRTRLFLGDMPVDGRSAVARRYVDHADALVAQVGGDPSPAQEMLIRNAASLATLLELDQARIAAGEPIDDDRYLRRFDSLIRALRALGLHRVARDITPALPEVVDHHAAAVRNARE